MLDRRINAASVPLNNPAQFVYFYHPHVSKIIPAYAHEGKMYKLEYIQPLPGVSCHKLPKTRNAISITM